MKRLDLLLKYYDAHIEGYACLFFILSLFKPLFFILLSVYIVFLYKKLRMILLIILFSLILTLFLYVNKKDNAKYISGNAEVINVVKKTYNNEITIKYKLKKYVFTTTKEIKLNSTIYIEGELKDFLPEVIDFGFNERNYYYKKGIKAKVNVSKLILVKESQKLNNLILNKISNLKIKPYLKMFLFNNNDELEKDLYNKLNILFLFKVSGLHLYSIVTLIKYLFRKKDAKKLLYYLEIGIYFFFYYLSNYNYSILRLLILTILIKINREKRYQFTKLDLIQFTFLLILITNPYLFFEIGFLLLFLILNLIHLLEPLYRGLNKNITISLIIQAIVLPFFSSINLLIVLLMPLLILIVSGPLFLLAITTVVFPSFDSVSFYLFTKFDYLLTIIDKFSTPFLLPRLSYILILLYFIVWFLILLSKNNYNKVLYIFYLFVIFYIPNLRNNLLTNVYFLSVGQGDSIYLESGSYNIMIDTFNGSYNFLVNKGIKELDYLFLTHPDLDHIKEADEIVKNINVNTVGLSYYESYPSNYNNVKFYKAKDMIKLGPFLIEVLGPHKNYFNSNDNSLVLKITIKNYKFLFTGDIEEEAENDLIENYNLNADIIKIAHHGSNTSSNELFIKKVKPKYAVISLGRDNKYGFPHDETIKTLMKNNIKIYRTDIDYTIKFNYHLYYKRWSIELPFKKKFWYNIILDEVF